MFDHKFALDLMNWQPLFDVFAIMLIIEFHSIHLRLIFVMPDEARAATV